MTWLATEGESVRKTLLKAPQAAGELMSTPGRVGGVTGMQDQFSESLWLSWVLKADVSLSSAFAQACSQACLMQ